MRIAASFPVQLLGACLDSAGGNLRMQVTHEGLTSAEVEKRLVEYGPNKLPEGTRNPFLVYLGYMWNPLSWAMEIAAILAIILLDYPDFCLILALLVMNATISYREEASADKVPACAASCPLLIRG